MEMDGSMLPSTKWTLTAHRRLVGVGTARPSTEHPNLGTADEHPWVPRAPGSPGFPIFKSEPAGQLAGHQGCVLLLQYHCTKRGRVSCAG